MPNLGGKRKLSGVILAVMTAGSLGLSAVAAQSSTQSAAIHKSSSSGKSAHSGTSSGKKTGGKSSSKKRAKKVKSQSAPTVERINEIQEALAKKGVFEGSPTGKMDDSTSEALRRFQATNGLTATGKLDALTLQKLGLGSETAGLAAPTPPPNAVNRLKNTSSLPTEPTDSDSESHN